MVPSFDSIVFNSCVSFRLLILLILLFIATMMCSRSDEEQRDLQRRPLIYNPRRNKKNYLGRREEGNVYVRGVESSYGPPSAASEIPLVAPSMGAAPRPNVFFFLKQYTQHGKKRSKILQIVHILRISL